MEFLIIALCAFVAIIVSVYAFKISIKEIFEFTKNTELNDIVDQYPSNIEICKEILSKIGNTEVNVEESNYSSTSLYIATRNKIIIGKNQSNFTRIQTIAHECIHSIQPKRLLYFNFIFSNIYLLGYVLVILLLLFKAIKDVKIKLIFMIVYLILSFIYFLIRVYLENDAMFKAKYLTKEYMEDKEISSREEINTIINTYEEVNKVAIKTTNVQIFIQIFIKLILFSIIALIF